jgi:excisionase family DNA binding protein
MLTRQQEPYPDHISPGTKAEEASVTRNDTPIMSPQQGEPVRTVGGGRERLEPLQVSIAEAARLLAYDTRTIRRLIGRGELPAVGEGRMRRVPLQSLRDYQQRHLTA